MKQETKTKENLFELIKQLKDHRRKQGKRHPLETVVLIIIMGIMSGSKSERAIARFAKNNKQELIETLEIAREEVPSKSVINGIIQNIEFEKLENTFYQWSKQLVTIKKGEWLNLDGKAIRGTVVNASTKMQDFVSLVTVFINKQQQALTAKRINTKKENEMPSVRQLIKMLDLEGVTFTLDALHCQEKTVKAIVETNNNYVIGVKNNQENLFKAVKKTAKQPSQKEST